MNTVNRTVLIGADPGLTDTLPDGQARPTCGSADSASAACFFIISTSE
jgi:hypothetical protein